MNIDNINGQTSSYDTQDPLLLSHLGSRVAYPSSWLQDDATYLPIDEYTSQAQTREEPLNRMNVLCDVSITFILHISISKVTF